MVPPVEADKRPLELTPPPSFFQTRIDLFEKRKAERKAWVDQQPREDIKIELLDGKVKDGTSWETSPADIAKAISKALYKKTVIARVDGELWDLDRPLEKSCRLELLDFNDPEGKKVFWHSSAHILGEAAERRWGCSLCIGPPVDNGFYYEMALPDGGAVTQADYEPLKQIAQKAINEKQPFERLELSKEDLLSMFSYNKYKQHIINDKIPDGTSTTVYRCGPLIDLCRGPHVPHTGHITVLEVMKNSSSYFLGDSKNDSLQRLYGVSFPEKDMMKKHKHMLEEAAKRDHRKVGQDQELFFFDQLSPGSAFFQKHGVVIYNALQSFVREEYWKRNYEEVISPNMYNSALWKQSGHWQHYKDDMFTFDVEKEQWALKPMNCPGHCVIYGHRERSYRELPIRMAEFGILHRNEASGALSGLTRVRRFVQDDSHIFCTEAQIEQEIKGLFDFIKTIYGTFGLSFKMKLSTMPEDHLGDEATWQRAEAQLTKALEEFEAETGTKWELNPGDGAFYGPKIDVTISDALNREFQSATIQLDFQLPQQFNLEYRTEEQAGGEGKKSEEKRADRKGDEKAEKKADQNTEKKVDERAERKSDQKTDKSDETVKELPLRSADGGTAKDVASYRRELTPGCARPVMIHRALYGSFERFIGILTEHFGGKWPFWLSPRQVLIVPVMLGAYDYCVEVQRRLRKERIHADVDLSGNTMSRKVRTGQLQQYNFIFVVGAKEMETNSVNVRNRDLPGTQKEGLPVPVEEIVSVLKNLRDERVLKNNYGEQSVGK